MAEIRAQRRLAAILAADVVGYSRLMEQDEVGTLAALKARRNEVLVPTVAQHYGRIVKVMGDGVLVEFGSAVDAVECAVEMQKRFAEANQNLTENRVIVLRIGINLGDVIIEGSDLYGDGVNIAARLESLAEPGGICVSSSVHDHVRRKLRCEFDDLGPQAVKNIAEPVHVFRIRQKRQEPARDPLSLPAKPSIAVLPFVNMGGDVEHEFFTDGLTEDIITDISNVPGFFVIARNSTFAYKGKPTDVRQIARDLGVRYILEGSARRAGQRLRVNVQLIDAAGGGAHIFADRFDREIVEIFTVQDEITRRVVEAITGRLISGPIVERRRPTNLEAYHLCVSARSLHLQSKSGSLEGRALLERAIALAPDYCEAHWRLAEILCASWLIYNEPQAPNRCNALTHAKRAVSLDPKDASAHAILGAVLQYEARWDEAEDCFDAAMRLNPNDAETLAKLSDFKCMSGKPYEAIECATKALRLNPHPPGFYYWFLGQAQIAAGKYEGAVSTLKRDETYRTTSRRDLCVALVKLGRISEAREEAKLFMLSNPEWRISTTFEGEAVFKNPDDKQFWVDAYRLAGLAD
ncbi:MAG: adenylate/guanylate cyclase domain-containing protein [Hyphomicrobiales bacterium]